MCVNGGGGGGGGSESGVTLYMTLYSLWGSH